ncbi:phosphonate ABC transporter, permease protein PhnE [Flavobacteriaceae bacterium MHTCC 0001]
MKTKTVKKIAIAIIIGTLLYLSALSCNVSLKAFTKGIIDGIAFLGELFPPDLNVLPEMIYPAIETIMISFLATIFGAILSFIFALAGAANLSPKWLKAISRFFMATERALPEIIIILLLVAALGLGPFPGVVALAIGCLGMLGRLFSDAIEEVNPKTIEAVQSSGATKMQVIQYVIIPEILPSLISNTLFRFEINTRLSVLLGAVGAGGIGYEIYYSFQLLEYERATTAILVVLLLVFMSEKVSDYFRKIILSNTKLK